MKVLLVLLCIALLMIPSLSLPVNVSGSYGQTWLNDSGNKNNYVFSSGLWGWGVTPMGIYYEWQIRIAGGRQFRAGRSGLRNQPDSRHWERNFECSRK